MAKFVFIVSMLIFSAAWAAESNVSEVHIKGGSTAGGSVSVAHVEGGAKLSDKPVHEGDLLRTGQVITVSADPKAYVDLKFSEGHQVRLKSDTVFKIESMAHKHIIANLLKGRTFVHFVKEADPGSFEVKTKTAVAGVRGTKFVTEFSEKKGTYVCVCDGKVEVSKPQGGEKQMVATGQDIWSKAGQDLEPAVNSSSMSNMVQTEFDSMTF